MFSQKVFLKIRSLLIYSVIFYGGVIALSAQGLKTPYKSTLPNGLNWPKIQSEFLVLLNELRTEKKLNVLSIDPVLYLAATDQAHYMDSTRKVSHDQKVKGKESPQKRLFYYNGTHDQVGENCMMIYINAPMKTKYTKEPIIAKTEKDIAKALFLGWKNSPGHYKNMILPEYDVAGLGYYFNKDSSRLMVAQVFGAKPFLPRKGLNSPDNAFLIKEFNPSVCECMNTAAWKELSQEITLVQGEDSIYLKCEKLNLLQRFFNQAGDGMFLDYVLREQFVCEKNNLLHGSPIYDGFMTKPVLFKDMLKLNKAPGNNFFAAIGPIPKEVDRLQYGLNYGIIKNGYSCSYTYVNTIPDANLAILKLIPKWIDNQKLEVKKDTFNGTLKFNVPFERGKTTITAQQKNELLKRLDVYKPFAKSIRIKTFSSIEGNEQINLKLQQERAAMLKEIILSVCQTELNTQVQSKENWEDFYKEVSHTKFSYLQTYTRPKIKEALQSKKMLDSLDIILRINRIAQIEIDLTASVDNNSEPFILLGAYQKALALGDSLNAFACQSRLMYYLRSYKITNNDITSIEIPGNRKYLAHLTNWVGLATNDPELFYTNKTREMAVLYSTIDTNYLPLQFNYCIMALKYIRELGDTIIPIDRLEAKMRKCYRLKTKQDSVYVDYMLLNYHIMTAYNNNLIHRFEKIDKPLTEIKNYFTRHEMTESEGVKLGLLFNLYGNYKWTLEMLHPMLLKYPQNNDILFLFLQTYASYQTNILSESEFATLLALAKKKDLARFKTWIDKQSFQLLRQPVIKTEFCKQAG